MEVPEPFHPSLFCLGILVIASSAHVTAFGESRAKTYTLPTWDGTIFITIIPSGNPEIRSMMISDGPLMPPNDEKLLELFTMFRRIPRRFF